MQVDLKFKIKAGDGQITFPIYRVPVSGGSEPVDAGDIQNLQVDLDRQVLQSSQEGVMVTAAYSNVTEGTHQIVITGALNNVAFALVYAVRAEELGVPAEVVAPNAYVSLAPTGEGTIEQQIKDLQDRMGTAEGEIVAITAALPDMATKEEVQETLGEILAAIQALPDGQAVSAQVALNTAAIEGLQDDVSQLGQEVVRLGWRRPKLYLDNATPNYEQYVQEAYIKDLPAGDVVLKCWHAGSTPVINFYTKGYGIYSRALIYPAINGNVYPCAVFSTTDPINYPIGKITGYVVLSDVTGFAANESNAETSYIDRGIAENLAYCPIISSYIKESADSFVDIALPDKIYSVVGDTLQIYFDAIFGVPDIKCYDVSAVCEIGAQYPRYYELTPVIGDVGTHTITFRIREKNGTILREKTCTVVVVNATAQPSVAQNVLCVGSSLTSGGQWAAELKRRLCGTGGNPAGKEFGNINFVGRKERTWDGTTVKFEATGGYRLKTYTTKSSVLYHFNFTAQYPAGELALGNTYNDGNGHILTISEINISDGIGNISCTSSSNYEQTGSGTLTLVSGVGASTLNYASSETLGNPFVYNGAISLQSYANEHCGGTIDIVSISELALSELVNRGGNSEYVTNVQFVITELDSFISMFRSAFPSVKFLLAFPALPDARGGLGVNYGAKGNMSIHYGLRMSWYSIINAIKKYINDNSLEDIVYIMDWLGEMDYMNDYKQTEKAVNVRASVNEIFGVNGMHPANIGYMQFADSAFRCFCNNLLNP